MKPSAVNCSKTPTTVLRASPSSDASARVDANRAPAARLPSEIASRSAAASWRDNETAEPRSSRVVHKVAPPILAPGECKAGRDPAGGE
jgi:hypothetical protein